MVEKLLRPGGLDMTYVELMENMKPEVLVEDIRRHGVPPAMYETLRPVLKEGHFGFFGIPALFTCFMQYGVIMAQHREATDRGARSEERRVGKECRN